MIHIIQNDPDVPPGGIVRWPAPLTLHHPYRGDHLPRIREMDGLIVLGGRMGADEDGIYPFLTAVRDLMGEAVQSGVPTLGICLGGQLLAMACGGRVVRNRWGERGTAEIRLTRRGEGDPLFRGLLSPFPTFQWHDDSFDLPPDADLLAGTAACPHQAFRIGSGWGVQFHPEITREILSLWAADEDPPIRERLEEEFRGVESACADVLSKIMENFGHLVSCRPPLTRCI